MGNNLIEDARVVVNENYGWSKVGLLYLSDGGYSVYAQIYKS